MNATFESDPHPGKPKILFIGISYSTHVLSWIDLLSGAELNVRLFSLQGGHPPADWPVRTYLTTYSPPEGLDSDTRLSLYPIPEEQRQAPSLPPRAASQEAWLAQIIQEWQPDIIQTFGMDPAGHFYFNVRNQYRLAGIGKWAHWLWGGSDLELSRLNPEIAPKLAALLRECDQLLSDNVLNHRYALELGATEEQLSPLNPVPGMGGVEVDHLARAWQGLPSQRRMILWPKAYDSPWSVALPVFEAIKLSWERLQPCTICITAMTTEGTRMWYYALPEAIRQHCQVHDRVPRETLLALMSQARVLLAPTLVDGFPNSLYEAMATGAFPIVSPLETITPVMHSERNALFARNLYPQEIAEALVRAMNDDALVDEAARRNLALVKELADRTTIRPRVVAYYEELSDMYRRSEEFRLAQRNIELGQR